MRALVVFAHPVPDSLGAAVRDRAVAGLEAGGHRVDLLDLYAEGFDPVLSKAAHAAHLEPPESKPDIAEHVRRLWAADALVLVYPTWWGSQPAMLKGWLDRVWAEGVAFHLPPGGGRIRGRLRNIRRLVVVTTHGSPRWINVLQGEAGKLVVRRGLRSLCHPWCRTRWIALYGVDRSTAAQRTAFLERVDARLRRL